MLIANKEHLLWIAERLFSFFYKWFQEKDRFVVKDGNNYVVKWGDGRSAVIVDEVDEKDVLPVNVSQRIVEIYRWVLKKEEEMLDRSLVNHQTPVDDGDSPLSSVQDDLG